MWEMDSGGHDDAFLFDGQDICLSNYFFVNKKKAQGMPPAPF